MGTQAPRVLASMQLVKGKDDDLIEWFEGLPIGERNRLLKKMLRSALFGEEVTQPQLTIVKDDRLAQLEEENRQLKQWAEQWFQYLDNKLQQVASAPTSAAAAPAVEEQPRVDEAVLQARKSRLKKASW